MKLIFPPSKIIKNIHPLHRAPPLIFSVSIFSNFTTKSLIEKSSRGNLIDDSKIISRNLLNLRSKIKWKGKGMVGKFYLSGDICLHKKRSWVWYVHLAILDHKHCGLQDPLNIALINLPTFLSDGCLLHTVHKLFPEPVILIEIQNEKSGSFQQVWNTHDTNSFEKMESKFIFYFFMRSTPSGSDSLHKKKLDPRTACHVGKGLLENCRGEIDPFDGLLLYHLPQNHTAGWLKFQNIHRNKAFSYHLYSIHNQHPNYIHQYNLKYLLGIVKEKEKKSTNLSLYKLISKINCVLFFSFLSSLIKMKKKSFLNSNSSLSCFYPIILYSFLFNHILNHLVSRLFIQPSYKQIRNTGPLTSFSAPPCASPVDSSSVSALLLICLIREPEFDNPKTQHPPKKPPPDLSCLLNSGSLMAKQAEIFFKRISPSSTLQVSMFIEKVYQTITTTSTYHQKKKKDYTYLCSQANC
ncbi:hypothetical protein VP01_546g1 [Puccinia sorghi]|uniref:Uncharacterized protein n=1 Tax=Puccinia sorghi TaxID=27349 RepID=A0A0L6ULI9_9BASI|nr:hypothetical protein VP01_546g1 [Puccinia sorghi]